MATIKDHVDVQAVLRTAVATQTTFGLQLFLVDDDQILPDQRIRIVSQSDYTDLTASTVPRNYANTFFGQKRVPQQLMLGRWVSAATSPYTYSGPALETDYTVWKAISDGTIKFTDSAANTDSITAVDFSAITSAAQIPTVLTAKLAALVAPSITGLDTSVFEYDALGRLRLLMSTSGSTAATVTLSDEGTGTDLTSATFLDSANGAAVAGVDAEEPTDAITAISALNDTYYNVHEAGSSDVQQVALAAQIEGLEKLLDLVITDSGALTTGETASVAYQVNNLSYKRTMCIFTKNTTEYPDAAVAGTVLPTDEGTTSWAFEVLSGVTDSGGGTVLTTTERTELESKNCNHIETIGSNTFMYNGLTAGGEEKRIMLARDWFVARIREGIFTDQLNQPLSAFDNPTLSRVENRIREVGAEAIARGILLDTAEFPWTVTIPDADDFTAAERATHTMTITDAFTGYLNSAVNDYVIVGTWSI
jgi:hypothetical protein